MEWKKTKLKNGRIKYSTTLELPKGHEGQLLIEKHGQTMHYIDGYLRGIWEGSRRNER